MEKIYMEENRTHRRMSGATHFSIVLSFLVAFFAIFSLATYGVVSNQGMNAVSYAAPPSATNIVSGDSLEFTYHDDDGGTMTVIGVDGSGTGGEFSVPLYTANNNPKNPVFCVEHNVNAPSYDQTTGAPATLHKGDAITDYGLLWLLNNSYANGVYVTTGDAAVPDANRDQIEQWITQTAIWMYLKEKHGDVTRSQVIPAGGNTVQDTVKVNELSDADVAVIKNTVQLRYHSGTEERQIYPASGQAPSNLYTQYVKPLVDGAVAQSGNKLLAVKVEGTESAKTTDEKFYQSKLVTVIGNPSGDLVDYTVTISGVEGAVIVGEDGKEVANNTLTAGKGFYVRVPVDKVEKEAVSVHIEVTGRFNTLSGNYFVAAGSSGQGLQKVVTVTGASKNVIAGADFSIVPDTGMNTAQTIYFIGLIVLLCGVGIVYANAKPVEQKQQ